MIRPTDHNLMGCNSGGEIPGECACVKAYVSVIDLSFEFHFVNFCCLLHQ